MEYKFNPRKHYTYEQILHICAETDFEIDYFGITFAEGEEYAVYHYPSKEIRKCSEYFDTYALIRSFGNKSSDCMVISKLGVRTYPPKAIHSLYLKSPSFGQVVLTDHGTNSGKWKFDH